MEPLSELPGVMRDTLSAWVRLRWDDLQFARLSIAIVLLGVLIALPLLVLLVRAIGARSRRRARVVLPAVLSVMQRSLVSPVRHAALVLFLLGVPFFAIAVADPRIVSVNEQATYSGARVAVLIDSSGSMVLPFDAPTLEPVVNRTFYTAVAAADRFVKLRMSGAHADRLAIIQFGNEAYVVTPFTTDYQSVLLSLRLIGEPRAWNQFNVFGTTIIQGLDQGLELFRTFNLLDGSQNMVIIFTDGNDGEATFRGRTLDAMMTEARGNRIPIYMVRLGYGKQLGDVPWDPLWKAAVEQSGGRFYAAANERDILRAVRDIDRASAGTITEHRSAVAAPAFAGHALIAVILWLAAGTLKLMFPYFRTFP